MATTTDSTTAGVRPARRTIVKGAAWAVPAVAIASAAPAQAASQEVWFEDLHNACKLPGASCQGTVGVTKGYAVAMLACTNVQADVTVTFGTASGTLNGEAKTWEVGPNPLVLVFNEGDETCEYVLLGLEGEPDSANAAIEGTVAFTWTSANGLSGGGTLTFSAPATPPCDHCAPPEAGSTPTVASEPEETTVEEPVVETTVEEPAVEEPAVEEPAPGADTEQTTASPQG